VIAGAGVRNTVLEQGRVLAWRPPLFRWRRSFLSRPVHSQVIRATRASAHDPLFGFHQLDFRGEGGSFSWLAAAWGGHYAHARRF